MKNEKLEKRIKELEYALETLCNVCLQVDDFELNHVFEAQEVLDAPNKSIKQEQ